MTDLCPRLTTVFRALDLIKVTALITKLILIKMKKQMYIDLNIHEFPPQLIDFLFLCYSSACWNLWVWWHCLQPPPLPRRQETQSHCRCVCRQRFLISTLQNELKDLLEFPSLHVKTTDLSYRSVSYCISQCFLSPSKIRPPPPDTQQTLPLPFTQVIKWGDRSWLKQWQILDKRCRNVGAS